MSLARYIRQLSLAVALVLAVSLLCFAQANKPGEYQVKAAYLYNFGKFVNWPSSFTPLNKNSFVICILGQDPFGSVLESTVAGERVSGKPVELRRISRKQDATSCRVLFISSSERDRLEEVLTDFAPINILTVSDMPNFTSRGGIIQFVVLDNKIRFEVNLTAAERSNLTLSSELLKVAVAVHRTPESGN
jgi:hypothetical protein